MADAAHIEKSIKPRDTAAIAAASAPASQSVVDHSFHLGASKPNQTLESIQKMPHAVPNQELPEGISAKLVLQHPQDGSTVMLKPYHAKIDPKTRAYASLPIHGWATMATKALFDKAGMGHLVEDVSAQDHNGTPVTAHQFAKGYRPLHEFGTGSGSFEHSPSVDPHDVQRIAVMDYLTNNSDRHAGNLMVNPDQQDHMGNSPLLAIDHEKNFQYSHNPSVLRNIGATDNDKLSHYFGEASPGIRLARRMSVDEGHENVLRWWRDNGSNIRSEMENQLSAIGDKRVREHVRQNFNARADSLDQWAQHAPESSPFEQQGPSTLMHRFPSKYVQEARTVEAHLPKDPAEAARKILDASVDEPFSSRNKAVLTEVVQHLVDKMDPKQLAELMQQHHHHPLFDVRHAIAQRRFTPEEAEQFRTHVRGMMDSSPDASEKFPFLAGAFDKTPEVA